MTTVDDLRRLLRHAARALIRRPIFAIIALITLGLGIGVNTAMFSIINVVFLKPLPVTAPDRLAVLWSVRNDQGLTEELSSYSDIVDWRERAESFATLAAFWTFPNGDVNLTGGAEPQRVAVARITPGFFDVLGIRPMHGRGFLEEEAILGNHRRAILSYGLWRGQFGADTTLIGRDVIVNGVAYTVVGIMPPELETRAIGILGTDVQLWRPLVPEDNQTAGRDNRILRVIGRLAGDATFAQAQAELSSIANQLEETYPESNRGVDVRVVPLREQFVKDVRSGLLFLFGAVAVVLLGACLNVANLLLIKAAGMRKQLAVQSALGASRLQLASQVVCEALLLGVGGAFVGLTLAFGIVRTFAVFGPAEIPLLADARIDLPVFLFTLAVMLLAVALTSLLPAIRAARPSNSPFLRQTSPGARIQNDRRAMKALNVAQIALAMVLLTVGVMFIRSFAALLRVDPGLDTNDVLTFQVELPMAATARYPQQPLRDDFFATLLQRIEALPSVMGVAMASAPPLGDDLPVSSIQLPGVAESLPVQANFRTVSANYFSLLGVRLSQGRVFRDTDERSSPRVVVVNEAFARAVWGSDDPIGKRIVLFGRTEADVVGVVEDVRPAGLGADVVRGVYLPTSQSTFNFMTIVVKTEGDPTPLVPVIRAMARDLDPTIPLHHIRTLEDIAAGSIAPQRFQMVLVTAFSMLLLTLAVVGTYGVSAYGVNERMNELGIRAAVGASPADIRKLVLGEGARAALMGTIFGAVILVALRGTMNRFIDGTSSLDVVTFVAAPLILSSALLFATLIPARRASRADPMRVLRSD